MSARKLFACVAVLGCTACQEHRAPLRYRPVVVTALYRLPGAVVRGASAGWWRATPQPVRYGDPLPVGVTMYCLHGTTRRGRYVRGGIVAADPRFFPLARYIELYVGRSYLGRFLVDDTGKKIRGARIDVWTSDCREARRFGYLKGTAVLVHPRKLEITLAGTAREPK